MNVVQIQMKKRFACSLSYREDHIKYSAFWLGLLRNKVKLLSHVQLFVIPWTIAYQATVHRVARVRHGLATKPPPPMSF